jgi:pyruvate/2-oxoglutarate dehydrogenase complex dihydrolipoamide acyltransferase (E2) component
MTVAKILKWLKSVGDPVKAGEVLLEIETDKVNYGIESPASGVVKLILVQPGDEVPVGGLVAVLGTADEIVDAPKKRDLLLLRWQGNGGLPRLWPKDWLVKRESTSLW